MNIKFYLFNDKRKKGKESYIYCYIRKYRHTLALNTQLKLTQGQFNNVTQRARKGIANESQVNKFISEFKIRIEALILDIKTLDPLLSPSGVLQAIRECVKGGDKKLQFDDCYNEFLQSQRTFVTTSTLQTHKKIYNHLKSFETTTATKIGMDSIDNLFLEKFEIYLYDHSKLNPNTVNKYLKIFKVFLNWAVKHKYIGDEFRTYQPKLKNTSTDIFVLTTSEILAIYEYDCDPSLSTTKDLFVFSCFVGQRFVDIANFSHQQLVIEQNEIYWKLTQQKTKTPVMVPIVEEIAKSIIEKYRGLGRFPQVDPQKYNEQLRQLAKESGFFDEPLTLIKSIGVTQKPVTKPKCEYFTSHLGRRSFITNALISGVPERVIKKVSGHRTDSEFQKYVKFTEQFTANQFKNANQNKIIKLVI